MINILIADDKEVFRRKIKRLDYFKTHNDQMQISFEAQNGEEALDIIKNSKVDIIITDIRMLSMQTILPLSIRTISSRPARSILWIILQSKP